MESVIKIRVDFANPQLALAAIERFNNFLVLKGCNKAFLRTLYTAPYEQ